MILTMKQRYQVDGEESKDGVGLRDQQFAMLNQCK
jgi:hypothetical protein